MVDGDGGLGPISNKQERGYNGQIFANIFKRLQWAAANICTILYTFAPPPAPPGKYFDLNFSA